MEPSTTTGIPCKEGHYCPVQNGGEEMNQCPGGTFGSSAGLTGPECSGQCKSGCVCPAGSTTDCPSPCPAGYYCLDGTGGAVVPIICPQGYYCPSGAYTPTICPAGQYCPAGTASI